MAAEMSLEEVERAVRAAPAYGVPEAVQAVLVERWPIVVTAEVLVADYHLRTLHTLTGTTGAAPVAGADHPAGRAFASGRPVSVPPGPSSGTGRVYVPLTARGDRLGVLVLGVSWTPGAAEAEAIGELGAVVGGALRIAWPHTDRYERARREHRMTLAAEVQWQLLPGRSIAGAEFAVSGHLEPAYSIGGDNFDWSTEADHLALSVTNGSGQGVRAALLTSLTVGALRNARRSGADPDEQAALAGDLVHTRYAGAEYTETLVMRIGLADGLVTAIDTGSPRVLRLRGSQVETIDLDHEPPLGMFSDLKYRPQHFTLDTGDRLVMVSDGVYAARSADDEEYGGAPLRRAVRDTRLLPAEEVPKAIIGGMQRYQGRTELADDAVVVCLDWSGRK